MKSTLHTRTLLYIITDSVTNSVFVSQVVTPLLKRMQYGQFNRCVILTCERKAQVIPQEIRDVLDKNSIELAVFPIHPYMGVWSMTLLTHKIKTALASYNSYTIIARGPLAGLLALQSYDTYACNKIIIQARGLLAEEYAFTHKTSTNAPLHIIHKARYYLFKQLEQKVYRSQGSYTTDIFFEVVSDELGEYIAQMFGTNEALIATPPFDATPIMPIEEHTAWRAAKRTELGIAPDARVFTYCGSYKPWQCPDATIRFFKGHYESDPSQILLIITNDVDLFAKRLSQLGVNPHSYRIINKPHEEVLHYLAAADIGILFREKHILNWVSRPTKALEYEAARLTISHNNTVAYLYKKSLT